MRWKKLLGLVALGLALAYLIMVMLPGTNLPFLSNKDVESISVGERRQIQSQRVGEIVVTEYNRIAAEARPAKSLPVATGQWLMLNLRNGQNIQLLPADEESLYIVLIIHQNEYYFQAESAQLREITLSLHQATGGAKQEEEAVYWALRNLQRKKTTP